jgi:hypothetical protein
LFGLISGSEYALMHSLYAWCGFVGCVCWVAFVSDLKKPARLLPSHDRPYLDLTGSTN